MKYLGNEQNKIASRLKRVHLYLFLDFDGTLTPIRKDPKKVRLGKKMRYTLKNLANKSNISVAVVSGRALGDIKRRVGLKNITYVGNHGLEASGPHLEFVLPSARKAEKTIKSVRENLKKRLKKFKGIIIEDKQLSLSVHYRMADKRNIKDIIQIIELVTNPHRKKHKIKVTEGKKVREIRPPATWDKGLAVKKLLELEKKRLKKRIVPICMGDDKTDEDIFKLFKTRGYAVKITKEPDKTSAANYYLRNTSEVRNILQKFTV